MAERLFVFVQFEFPGELGPPDGRYLLRGVDGEPEHVVVLGTVQAARRAASASGAPPRRVRRPRGASRPATPEPAPVATARATIIDAASLSAEGQAEAWLAQLDAERETRAAIAVVNRMLYLHRIASADPYLGEVSPAQALVIRVGWGEGEQVADGRWLVAREVPAPSPGRGGARGPLDASRGARAAQRRRGRTGTRGAQPRGRGSAGGGGRARAHAPRGGAAGTHRGGARLRWRCSRRGPQSARGAEDASCASASRCPTSACARCCVAATASTRPSRPPSMA